MKKAKTINIDTYIVPDGYVLVMKNVKADNTAYDGFLWPDYGFVKCDKWVSNNECGNGIHGFLKGEGDGSLAIWDNPSIWKLCEVKIDGIKELGGKVKFENCNVIFSGDLQTCAKIMMKIYPECKVIGGTATAGDSGTATAGHRGTATAGDSGTLIITYYDAEKMQYKRKISLVGENDILPNVKYRLNDKFEFEQVK